MKRREVLVGFGALLALRARAAEKATMKSVMQAHVDRGEPPGLIAAVRHGDKTLVEVMGRRSPGSPEPLRRDAIFRIASMSKPVTAVATLILIEEGKLGLDEPVERLLPELANRRVLKKLDGPLDDTVPAKRSITVRDLLTFQMGFGIVWGPPDATPIQRAAASLHLGAFGPPKPQEPPGPDEWMRRFATLPLMHQPGEAWRYNTSAEVLSVLIARAARMSLGDFLRERIFEPLGMHDTGFSVPTSKLSRLPPAYMAKDPFHPDGSGLELYDPAEGGQWATPPAFPSGAGGLVSTVDDFLAFGAMLLGRGISSGRRILSAASVDQMTRDQLSAEVKASAEMPGGFWENHGWGFGTAVVTGNAAMTAGPGGYGWDGGLGTSWWSDPKEGRAGVLLTQRSAFPTSTSLYRDFWATARRV